MLKGGISLIRALSEYIFPIFCLGCDREGVWLCRDCEKTLVIDGVSCCPVCHLATASGNVCSGCQSRSMLSRHMAMMSYAEEGLIGDIIRHIKYHYIEDLLEILRIWMARYIEKHAQYFSDIEIIVPVPLHKKRFAERGFNQAELIAAIVAECIDRPIVCTVTRIRQTPHQARLDKKARMENVVNAFFMPETSYRRALIVDDVYTTGSTMQELARAMKQAGVRDIRGFSIARG